MLSLPGHGKGYESEFETARRSCRAAEPGRREPLLARTLDLYCGPLLPGYYEDWILTERDRLETIFIEALHDLIALLREDEAGLRRALETAHRAVCAAPLREEPHLELIRLYEAAGQPVTALRHYEELERLLRSELGVTPSADARAVAQRAHNAVGSGSPLTEGTSSPGSRIRSGRASRRRAPTAPAVPAAVPADRRSPAPPRLPPSLNRFFGREEELVGLVALLSPANGGPPARLVTITGPGGTGKTRLALEAARRLDTGTPRWFVPLADLADPGLIPGAVLDAMDVPRSASVDPLDQVVTSLAGQPTLLLLDNFEQLAAGGVSAVQALLRRLPDLTCLVTSRRRLALPGEVQFPVPPLPVPDDPSDSTATEPEAILRYPGVELFADRARAVSPDFQVTRGNARAVAALCHRLEGIPLAVELAAARAQAITPGQMLAQLAQSGRAAPLLTARGSAGSTRHGSLWKAIDWSYDLLTSEQRRFFLRLSVFRGGCTPDAAAEICEEPGALEYLAQLRERSLVVGEEAVLSSPGGDASGIRFRLLESLREYAWGRLSPEERAVLQRRHAEYFQALAVRAEPELMGAGQEAWLARLHAEHDNLRAAIHWAAHDAEPESECGLLLAGALFRFWLMRGFLTEGRQHLAAVLGHAAEAASFARGKALNAAGVLAQHQADSPAARALYEAGLAICRRLGVPKWTAALLGNLGTLASHTSDFELARVFLEESTATRREVGDRWGVANNLNVQGIVAKNQGDYALAEQCYSESLNLFREVGDRRNSALVLGNQGNLASAKGDDALALALHEEALTVYRQIGDREDIAERLGSLADIACRRGEYQAAAGYLQEGLSIARKSASRPQLASLLSTMGHLAVRTGEPGSASAHFRESLTIYRDFGSKHNIAALLESVAHLAALESKSRAGLRRAARLFGAAEGLREQIGAPHAPAEQHEYDRQLASARASLDARAWASAWGGGRALTMEQAIAEALQEIDDFTLPR